MTELVSTRDLGEVPVNYTEALMQGLAPEGGLYVMRELPKFLTAELRLLAGQNYEALYTYIKSALIGGDIPREIVSRIAAESYGTTNFPEALNGNITPVEQIGDTNIFVEDLSGGPTGAFKDLALQPTVAEMDYELEKRGETQDTITSTSGDTGPAGQAAIKPRRRLTNITLSPEGGTMTAVQRAQMGEQSGDSITNISVKGTFDDCQDLVKALKDDPEFNDLGNLNSINIGRVLAQIPYYFSGYLQTIEQAGLTIGDQIDVVVPSGNFGNILAGHLARRMGLPIRMLVAATNENDVLDTLVQTGTYKSKTSVPTSSPSMDISKASNYERLAYELLDEDPSRTAEYMHLFDRLGHVSFSEFGLPDDILHKKGFDSGVSTSQDRLDTILWAHEESDMSIDPHTADAVTVARRMKRDLPVLCMSTARPFKFEHTMKQALGFVPERPERFVGLEERAAQNPDAFIVIENDLDMLKRAVRNHRERQAA